MPSDGAPGSGAGRPAMGSRTERSIASSYHLRRAIAPRAAGCSIVDLVGEPGDATAPTVAVERGDVSHEETLPATPPAPGAATPADATSLATVPASAYTILGEHGRGGLGRILRARDERTGRVVAIKEILDGNVDAAARFVRGALGTAHPPPPAIA